MSTFRIDSFFLFLSLVGLVIGSIGSTMVRNITFRDSVMPSTYKGEIECYAVYVMTCKYDTMYDACGSYVWYRMYNLITD